MQLLSMQKLPREFYQRETTEVAKSLLGQYLVHRSQGIERVGKIVEVEAYLGQHDLASHSSKGRTKRTEVMFGPPGFSYVYLIYGIHHCFNVVTDFPGAAVLIRAIEPMLNISGRTQGPGLLCRAMGLDRQHNAHDLLSDDLFVAKADNLEQVEQQIIETPRIGVHYAKEWALKPLRFYIEKNAFVSK